MDFSLSDEQREIASLAERVFSERATPDAVAAVEATDDRFDAALWANLAEAGLLGLVVPESAGGAGLGLVEASLVLEQQGRQVAPIPLAETYAAALTLASIGAGADLLSGVATGDVVLTAPLGDAGSRDPARPSVSAQGGTLSGDLVAVTAVSVARRILVPALDGDTAALFLLDPSADGIAREPTTLTNRAAAAHIRLTDAPAERVGGADAVRALRNRATVALCAVQLGVAEEAVKMAAAYTSERKQFGRTLSTNQGVALRAADAYIDAEAMRVTLWQAAWLLDQGADAEREVAVAKWWAAEGGHRVVHAVQHLHGGLGADVSYPVHRYFLWGKQNAHVLGSGSEHLATLGARIAADTKAAVS